MRVAFGRPVDEPENRKIIERAAHLIHAQETVRTVVISQLNLSSISGRTKKHGQLLTRTSNSPNAT